MTTRSTIVATNTSMAATLDTLENATSSLLAAAGELSRFPWTASSSEIVDEALHVAALVEELKANQEPEQLELPGNVVQFRGRMA